MRFNYAKPGTGGQGRPDQPFVTITMNWEEARLYREEADQIPVQGEVHQVIHAYLKRMQDK